MFSASVENNPIEEENAFHKSIDNNGKAECMKVAAN
jgi:hypothetical protein